MRVLLFSYHVLYRCFQLRWSWLELSEIVFPSWSELNINLKHLRFLKVRESLSISTTTATNKSQSPKHYWFNKVLRSRNNKFSIFTNRKCSNFFVVQVLTHDKNIEPEMATELPCTVPVSCFFRKIPYLLYPENPQFIQKKWTRKDWQCHCQYFFSSSRSSLFMIGRLRLHLLMVQNVPFSQSITSLSYL